MTKHLFLTSILTLGIASFAHAENQQDKVLATVNGQKVFNSEIKKSLSAIPDFSQLPEDQKLSIKSKLLDSITKLNAVVQEAQKLNIQEEPIFKDKLADFKRQLMYSTLLEKHLDSYISDAILKEFYTNNQAKFIEDKAKASHILVKTEDQAKQVIQQLNAGADFIELAEKESIGPSSKDGGNLGWFNKETMVEEFSNATFALEIGEYTKQAVQTQFGWHVIFLTDKIENTPSLFKDVKEQITQEVMQNEAERYITNILDKTEIVIND